MPTVASTRADRRSKKGLTRRPKARNGGGRGWLSPGAESRGRGRLPKWEPTETWRTGRRSRGSGGGGRIAWSQALDQGLDALARREDGHDVPEAAAARADKPSMATERPTSAS
jgi:hypothetical protein